MIAGWQLGRIAVSLREIAKELKRANDREEGVRHGKPRKTEFSVPKVSDWNERWQEQREMFPHR